MRIFPGHVSRSSHFSNTTKGRNQTFSTDRKAEQLNQKIKQQRQFQSTSQQKIFNGVVQAEIPVLMVHVAILMNRMGQMQ